MAPLFQVRISKIHTVYHGRFKDGTFASGMAPLYWVRIKDGAFLYGKVWI